MYETFLLLAGFIFGVVFYTRFMAPGRNLTFDVKQGKAGRWRFNIYRNDELLAVDVVKGYISKEGAEHAAHHITKRERVAP